MSDFMAVKQKVYLVKNNRYPYIQISKSLDREVYNPVWVAENGLSKIHVCKVCFYHTTKCTCRYTQPTLSFNTEQKCIDWFASVDIDIFNPVRIVSQGTVIKGSKAVSLPAKIVSLS